jgi:hypothetical protein
MKTKSRKRTKGSPIKNRTPLAKGVCPPIKQEQTARDWNATSEIKNAVFHGLQATKYVWLLCYHGAIAFCKLVKRAGSDHVGRIIFLLVCLWLGSHIQWPFVSHIFLFIGRNSAKSETTSP